MLKGKKFCGISERLLSKMSATAGTLARFGHDPALDFAPSAASMQLSVKPLSSCYPGLLNAPQQNGFVLVFHLQSASGTGLLAGQMFQNERYYFFESSPLKWLSTFSRLSGFLASVNTTE